MGQWRGRRAEDGPCPVCGHEQREAGPDYCSVLDGEPWVVTCMRIGGAEVAGWKRVKWNPAKNSAVYKREDVVRKEAQEWRAEKLREEARGGGGGGDSGGGGSGGEWAARRAEAERAKAERDRERAGRACELWESADPESGTDPVVLGYFKARGVDLGGVLMPWVRFLPMCPCYRPAEAPRPDGKKTERLRPGPCILFAATNARGAVVGVQRIYLDPRLDPREPPKKRGDCGNPKKALGALSGAAIRFAPGEASGIRHPRGQASGEEKRPGLVICEGPETAAAVWVALDYATPVWSVISTAGMTSVELSPAELEELAGAVIPGAASGRAVVFGADMDRWHEPPISARPGVKAALEGATRLRFAPEVRRRGVRVGVAIPSDREAPDLVRPGPGMFDMLGDLEPEADGSARKSVDWLDVYLAGGADAVTAPMARAAAAALAAPPLEREGGEQREENGVGASGASEVPVDLVHQGGEGAPFDVDAPLGGAALAGGEGGGPEPNGQTVKLANGQMGGGESGGVGGSGGGGGGGGEIRMMPAGQLDAARAMLVEAFSPVDVATHPKGIEGRAHERFTVAYLTQQDQWMAWVGGVGEEREGRTVGARWVGVTKEQMRGKVLAFFNSWSVLKSKPKLGEDPIKPAALAARTADGIVAAMQADAAVCSATLPTWAPATFDSRGRPAWEAGLWPGTEKAEVAHDVIPMRDGLLEVNPLLAKSGGRVVIRPHTPRYLSTVCLPYDAPVAALEEMFREDPEDELGGGDIPRRLAPNWIGCIGQQADGDQASLDGLQQWFGYLLTPDISYEAIALVPGPPRSGKGTQLVAVVAMLGLDAVAMTSFGSIGERFEAAIFRGRRVAIMSDAHVDSRHASAATERVKGMSAGDPVSTESKFEDKVPVEEIPIKFMIFTNTIPKLPDPSGALAARLVVLPTRESFSGKEDRGLKRRVQGEGPGIFVWAVSGLRRLRKAGKFTMPDDGREMLEQFSRLSSPVMAFLKDCACQQSESKVGEGLFHDLYSAWAEDQGVGRMSKERFFAEMQAARPSVRRRKVKLPISTGRGGTPANAFSGVRPKLAGVADTEAREVFDPHDVEDFGFPFPVQDGSGGGSGGGEPPGGAFGYGG